MSDLSDRFVTLIREIVHDESSGSTEIGRRLLLTLSRYIEHSRGDPRSAEYIEAALRAAEERPSILLVGNMLRILREVTPEVPPQTAIDGLLLLYDQAVDRSLRNARDLVKGHQKVLTYSYSSNVIRLLSSVEVRSVYVSACWPSLEGLRTAASLREAGVHSIVIGDMDVLDVVERVDLVLVGCDAVLRDGSLVNRRGTRTIVEAAKQHHVRALAIADSLKVDYWGSWSNERRRYEVRGVEVDLEVFDVTPCDRGHYYVTEYGVSDGRSLIDVAFKSLESEWISRLKGVRG
ncbi:MAG: hypothetical protein NZ920_01620 [Aigarchaeota archaeon]|nr:hypothetical protein [Aigarchaeota archaeon]MDW8093141.1 hypothetical protein [Nitrososphaerota archaeon]